MTEKNPPTSGLDVVRAFLRKYYHDEEWEDRGTIKALQDLPADRQYPWRLKQAFDEVLDTDYPDGTLQQLVFTAANRDIITDADAREFLERIYVGNTLDVAVDFDEPE